MQSNGPCKYDKNNFKSFYSFFFLHISCAYECCETHCCTKQEFYATTYKNKQHSDNNIWIWFVVIILVVLTLGVILCCYYKKKNNNINSIEPIELTTIDSAIYKDLVY
jgi:heme/copper-type cytochrome/quinol oxidase subunit 2